MENNRRFRLTIGLPVYNGENYLGQALLSLVEQTFKDFQLIISDNASTDKTQEISERFQASDPRVRYIRHEKNLGAAENFNLVYRLADTEYFKWVAHDDLLDPRFLEECIRVLDQNPSVILAYSKSTKIDETGQAIGTYDYPMRVDHPHPNVRFHDLIFINHFCIAIFGVIRTQALLGTPLIGAFSGSDRTLLAELGLKGRLYEIDQYLFHRRDHPNTSGRKHRIYDRESWFKGEKLRKSIPTVPNWRIGWVYLRIALKTRLSLKEKFLSLRHAFAWFIHRRKALFEDVKATILFFAPFSRKISEVLKSSTGKKKQGGML